MKIVYSVPFLSDKGGIQSWAHTIAQKLPSTFTVRFINPMDKTIANKIIMFRCIREADFLHFWSIEGAFYSQNIPYIVSCHGLDLITAASQSYKSSKLILSRAKYIIANSLYVKNLLHILFKIDSSHVIIIPPCISMPNKNFIRHIIHTPVNVGTISRFVARKNIISVINALNILTRDLHIGFYYHIAGVGPEINSIVQALHSSSFQWKYWGEISEDVKLRQFYPLLDIFVMTPQSLKNDPEGFGLVYLEANSFGIPIIGSKVGGTKDAIIANKTGVFADPKNPRDIAQKISYAIAHYNKLSQGSYTWAKKHDVDLYYRQFCKIYQTVLF